MGAGHLRSRALPRRTSSGPAPTSTSASSTPASLTAGLVGVGCYLAQLRSSRAASSCFAFAIGVPLLVLGRYAPAPRPARAPAGAAPCCSACVIAGSRRTSTRSPACCVASAGSATQVVGALTPATTLSESHAPASGVAVLGNADEATLDDASSADIDVIFVASGALGSAASMRQARLGPRGPGRPGRRGAQRHRRLRRPDPGAPRRRPAADAPRAPRGPRTPAAGASGSSTWSARPCLLLAVRPGARWSRRCGSGSTTAGRSSSGRPGSAATAAEFACLKFRTMVVDAEARLAASCTQEQGDEAGLFKMKDDPASPGPGRWLRPLLARRAAAAVQRAARRHEPRRPAAAAAARGRARTTTDTAPPPARPPRHDRPVAGLRPLGPLLGEADPPRPLLRRQLVDAAGPLDPGAGPSARCSAPAGPTEAPVPSLAPRPGSLEQVEQVGAVAALDRGRARWRRAASSVMKPSRQATSSGAPILKPCRLSMVRTKLLASFMSSKVPVSSQAVPRGSTSTWSRPSLEVGPVEVGDLELAARRRLRALGPARRRRCRRSRGRARRSCSWACAGFSSSESARPVSSNSTTPYAEGSATR